ncbi:MAG: hypothetical protein JOZ96_23785 [Acidobacteria bacterium]|nr:hypothetical protein [Acidobacteriota bacterium]
MRYTFLALILFLACTQTPSTRRESDREHDGFAGPVKKVFVWWSPVAGWDYPADSRCRQETRVYDQSGRLMQLSVYPGNCGSDEIKYDYSYGQGGSRTEKSQEIRGKDSPPPPPPVMVPRSNSEEDRGEPRMLFKYDPASGRESESSLVRPGGKVIYRTAYTYDDKGRLTEVTDYSGNGQVSTRRVYGYSGEERVPSSFVYYDGKGNAYERATYSDYEFNARGDWVRRREAREERFNRRNVSTTVREIEYYQSGK